MVELDKESLRRLDTWIGVIAGALGPDAPVASTTDGLRLGRKGSLSISADGWYDFEASVGGRDALILIQHLRGRSAEDAAYFALDWLGRYLGDGDFAAAADLKPPPTLPRSACSGRRGSSMTSSIYPARLVRPISASVVSSRPIHRRGSRDSASTWLGPLRGLPTMSSPRAWRTLLRALGLI
jgi:hypothetical protein